MRTKIERVVKVLELEGDTENASILNLIETDCVNVQEAFGLGLALQKLYDRVVEFGDGFVDEEEVLEVIEYVKVNIAQTTIF